MKPTNTSTISDRPEKYTDNDDYVVAIWPDGTWCQMSEIDSYLTFMSDDYEEHIVLSYDEAYCPIKTRRVL